jgi:hypothetical protein
MFSISALWLPTYLQLNFTMHSSLKRWQVNLLSRIDIKFRSFVFYDCVDFRLQKALHRSYLKSFFCMQYGKLSDILKSGSYLAISLYDTFYHLQFFKGLGIKLRSCACWARVLYNWTAFPVPICNFFKCLTQSIRSDLFYCLNDISSIISTAKNIKVINNRYFY